MGGVGELVPERFAPPLLSPTPGPPTPLPFSQTLPFPTTAAAEAPTADDAFEVALSNRCRRSCTSIRQAAG